MRFKYLIILLFILSGCNKQNTTPDKEDQEEKDLGKNLLNKKEKKQVENKKDKTTCNQLFERHNSCFIKTTTDIYNVKVGDSPWKGSKNAPVTIVEFTDYQCPACRYWSLNILPKLLDKYKGKIKLVFKNFPLNYHVFANLAAQAALEVYRQKGNEAYWTMHDVLFYNQKQFSEDFLMAKTKSENKFDPDKSLEVKSLKPLLKKLGVDLKKYRKNLEANKNYPIIEKQVKFANQIKVNATPTLYINGKKLGKNQNIVQLIEMSLEESKKLADKGIKPEKIYNKLVDHGKLVYEKPIDKKILKKEIKKIKEMFIKKCSLQQKPLVFDIMLQCSSKDITCDQFTKCVETKMKEKTAK
ncbi:MAG: DsbA family protein [Myxococcota bacterium]